jgi:hypothetical protein
LVALLKFEYLYYKNNRRFGVILIFYFLYKSGIINYHGMLFFFLFLFFPKYGMLFAYTY